MGQRGEVGLFAFVQGEGSRGLDQRLGLLQKTGVVGRREHPGFAEMRHDEIGRGFARRVEQADGIAIDEVERPHGFIVRGDSLFRCPRKAVSLGVPAHGGQAAAV
jgi:hypothetical protein